MIESELTEVKIGRKKKEDWQNVDTAKGLWQEIMACPSTF